MVTENSCRIENVELQFATASLTLTGDSGCQESFDLRVPFPSIVDGMDFSEFLFHHLNQLLEATDGDEHEFYRCVYLMMWFYSAAQGVDPRRRRIFSIRTLDESETLSEIAELKGATLLPRPERLIACVGEPSFPTTRLLQEAIYVNPNLKLPLARKHYLVFRAQMLDEVEYMIQRIAEIKENGINKARERTEANEKLEGERRDKALGFLAALEEGEEPDCLPTRLQRLIKHIFKEAMRDEESHAAKFADLVARATALQLPVAREVEERHLSMLAGDGVTFSKEYVDCIVRNFDAKAADAFLDAVIRRFEDVHGIKHFDGIEAAGEPVEVTVEDLESFSEMEGGRPLDEELNRASEEMPVELQQYWALVGSRYCCDIFDKWFHVGWITTNLVNRNECIRLLHREADSVYQGVLDYTFRLVYRKIRHGLSRVERRAFQLLYFRQAQFGYRIAAFDPVLMSFFTGMDDETQALLVLVLGCKRHEFHGRPDLGKELDRRWRAYLRFYPYWLEIIRDEDREAKRQQTIWNKTLSIEQPIGRDENDNKMTLRDILHDHRNKPADLLRVMVTASGGKVADWATKYCTKKQAAQIIRHFTDDKTETEIAKEYHVSQQAVSKNIRKGLERIHKGLLREGLIAADLMNSGVCAILHK